MIKLIIIIYFLNLSLIFTNVMENYTFNIDSTNFNIKIIENEETILFNIFKNDTLILSHEYEGYPYIKIEDINKDSIIDIKLDFYNNNLVSYLYLWDSQNKIFKKVMNFESHSESNFIKKNLFYSYNAIGCADADWISNLVLIDCCFSTHVLASITVTECNIEDKNIVFTDLINKKTKLLESYGNDKFEFIKNYWYKNFTQLLGK